jgi:putative flavoprotein involved in K+ transport
MNRSDATYVPTIVIGGGQAGLATGYYLAKQRLPFLILDAHARVGDAWRQRWDSLRLFNPARYVALPGMRMPTRGSHFPTKDEIADYLEDYALRFALPVRNNMKVTKLWREGDRFVLLASGERFEADNVIVAMANYQTPKTPSFASELDSGIVQLHSHNYRNLSQLQDGPVLIVGLGNSGGDIAMEVAKTHPVWVSGKESGHIPWPIESFAGRNILIRLVAFLGHRILTVATPIGRKHRPKLLHQAAPLIRVKPHDLEAAGANRVARVVGVQDGLPKLEDGRTLNAKNVIWCTGYEHGFPWVDLPAFDAKGEPTHDRGVVPNVPGFYFVGLHFLYAMTSANLLGVGRDAKRIVRTIAGRSKQHDETTEATGTQGTTAAMARAS